MLNAEVVSKYFKDLSVLVTKLNLTTKPDCIWNCDETGKQLSHDPVRVLAKKGTKSVVGRTSNDRTNITIMACANASGKKMPPMLVVKGKTRKCLDAYNVSAAPPGTYWCFQEKAWMNDEIGELWFRQVFLPNCGEQRPQLLVLDGHSSHESLSLLELAESQDIHIMSLPPHTTHALQPLDKAVFGPFNKAYNKVCSEYLSASPVNVVNKWTFPYLFKLAWDEGVTEKNIKSGFSACGIYPLNPNAISQEHFLPAEPTDRLVTVPSSSSVGLASESLSSVSQSMDAPVISTVSSVHVGYGTILSEPSVPLPISETCSSTFHTYFHQPTVSSVTPSSLSLVTSAEILSSETVLENSNPSAPVSVDSACRFKAATVTLSELDAGACSPLNLSTESGDFDLENPSVLLELINSGKLEIIAQGDQSGMAELPFSAEVDNDSSYSASDVSISTEAAAPLDSSVWQKEIDAIFLPPKIASPCMSSSKTGKKNTTHRILTSKEVIEEKKKQLETKAKLQNEKIERKQLREQKKKEMQTKRLKKELLH